MGKKILAAKWECEKGVTFPQKDGTLLAECEGESRMTETATKQNEWQERTAADGLVSAAEECEKLRELVHALREENAMLRKERATVQEALSELNIDILPLWGDDMSLYAFMWIFLGREDLGDDKPSELPPPL